MLPPSPLALHPAPLLPSCSLFDPSKEMVFITMSKEEKETGKAAVDVLGNQIGKTGGSWLMQVGAGPML